MKIPSLRSKMNRSTLLICVIVSILYGPIHYLFETYRYENALNKVKLLIKTTVQQKYKGFANQVTHGVTDALDLAFHELMIIDGVIGVSAYRPDGSLICGKGEHLYKEHLKDDLNDLPASLVEKTLEKENILTYIIPINDISETIGYMRVCYALDVLEKEIHLSFYLFFILLIALFLLVSLGVRFTLTRFVIKPVLTLTDAMKKVREGKVGAQVEFKSADEIGQMAAIFNEMSDRLLRMQDQLHTQNHIYHKLYEVSKKFNATFDLTHTLKLTSRFVIHELKFERCLVFLWCKKTKDFQVKALDGYLADKSFQHVENLRLCSDNSVIMALESGKEKIMRPASDQCAVEDVLRAFGDNIGMTEFVIFPMIGRSDRLIGLLAAGNSGKSSKEHTCVQSDTDFMFGLSNLVSLVTTTIESLIESEQKYRLLAENISDIISVFDVKDLRFTYVSPSIQKILGYSKEEAKARTLEQMFTPESFNLLMNTIHEELLIEKSHVEDPSRTRTLELEQYRKDGSTVWIEVKASLLRNHNGEPFAILSIARDISNRRKAEQALRASEKKYRELYEGSRDGIVMADLTGRIMECNSCFSEMLGYTVEELFMKNVKEITSEKCHNPEKNIIKDQALVRGYTDVFEKEFIRKDGVIIPAEVRIYVIQNTEGIAIGFWGFVRNITEKKTIQAEAMRQGHLASIGELAAGVAHEINNPLNCIIGYAQILMDRFPTENEDKDIPKRIMKDSGRIEMIIKSLLSFARERKEEMNIVSVQTILSETLCLSQSQLKKDRIQVIIIDTSEKLPEIKANAQQIQQVFLNIISNARYALNMKYPQLDPNKILEIQTEMVEQEKQKKIRITFSDRGTGIPAHLLDRICDPFFTTKPINIGTGLGLSISHGIIHDHQGKLWFESQEGEYTKAIIELPSVYHLGYVEHSEEYESKNTVD